MLMSIFRKENWSFLKSWIQHTPAKEIQNLRVPTLIIAGTADLQVPVTDAEELHQARPKSTFYKIEKMNHVLKKVANREENMQSYRDPGYRIPTELIDKVVDFIKH